MSASKIQARIRDEDVDHSYYVGNLNLIGFVGGKVVHLKKPSGDPLELSAACGTSGGFRYGWQTVEYFGERRPLICLKCRKAIEASS